MKTPEEVLALAKETPRKSNKHQLASPLDPHKKAISNLRKKGYNWKEIAGFLMEAEVIQSEPKLYYWVRTRFLPKGQ